MTVGFPDFGRQTVQSGPTTLKISQVVTTTYVSPLTLLGNYPYMNVFIDTFALVNFYEILFEWYEDSAGTLFTGAQHMTVGPGQQVNVQVPALGQWFRVIITAGLTPDTVPIVIKCIATTGGAASLGDPFTVTPLAYLNVTLGAGANQTKVAQYISPGKATLSLWNSANHPGHASVDYYDWASDQWISYAFAEVTTSIRAANVTVGLPWAPVRLSVTNDDTVSRGFVASLSLQP